MGRYLSLPLLGISAALTASVIPQVIGFAVALQGDLLPFLADTRGQLSLVLLFVLCWSIRAAPSESLIWAMVGGIMLDLLSVLPLGASAFALALLAFITNGVARQLFRVRVLFLLLITPIATIVITFNSLAWLALLGHTYDIPALARSLLLPTILYNLLAVLPVYALVRLVQRRLEGGLQSAAQILATGADTRPA